jgi:hypothetical protein
MTLNDIAYKILETYRAYIRNSESIDIRELYHKIHTTRAKLIKQKIEKYPLMPIEETFNQSIGSQKLELVDSSVVTGLLSGRKMLRTINNIPLPLFNNNGEPLFAGISGGDLLSPTIKMVTFEQSKYVGNGRFNKNTLYGFYYNNKIYLTSGGTDYRQLKYITGRGIFQDPMSAGLLTNSSYDEKSEYPISFNMAVDLENIILSEDYKLNVLQPVDQTSNQTDDIK